MAGEFDYQNTAVQWDNQGRPYVLSYTDDRGRTIPRDANPSVRFISPAEVTRFNSYGRDPKLAAWAQGMGKSPGASVWKERGVWDPKKGKYDQGLNWGNIGAMGVGAMFAAPAIGAAMGAGGWTGYGAAAAAPGTAAPAAVPTTAALLGPQSAIFPGTQAALPSITSNIVGTTAATTAGTVGSSALPAVLGTAAGVGAPIAANLFGPPADSPLNPANARTPQTPPQTPPPQTRSFWNSIPWLDIAKGGRGMIEAFLGYRASEGATEAQLAAEREALDFAKRAYDEQNKKEQERWDANEARRVPYREASLASLKELRRVLGY